MIRQHELADVLARLGNDQGEDFYRWQHPRLLVAGVRPRWHLDAGRPGALRVVGRTPVRVTYGGMRVAAAALPSSGGVVLGQMLAMLEGFEMDRLDRVQRAELIIGAMRLAYRDRARHSAIRITYA